MTRKKLYIEQAMVDKTVATREALITRIREFADHLKSEGVLLTKEILNQFMQQGWPAVQAILVNQAKKKLKVHGKFLSETLENDADRIAREFHKYHQRIRDAVAAAHISASEVEIKYGKPVLSDKDKDEIREQYTVYLQEQDEDLYTELLDFMKALEKLSTFLDQRDIDLREHLVAPLTESDYILSEPTIHTLRDDTLFISSENLPWIRINPKFFAR